MLEIPSNCEILTIDGVLQYNLFFVKANYEVEFDPSADSLKLMTEYFRVREQISISVSDLMTARDYNQDNGYSLWYNNIVRVMLLSPDEHEMFPVIVTPMSEFGMIYIEGSTRQLAHDLSRHFPLFVYHERSLVPYTQEKPFGKLISPYYTEFPGMETPKGQTDEYDFN